MFAYRIDKMLGLCFLLLLVTSISWAQEKPEATTSLGTLRGHWMRSREGHLFYAFSGVPYAKPPVGDLTFKVSIS